MASTALENGVAALHERAHAFRGVLALHHGQQVFEKMFDSFSLAGNSGVKTSQNQGLKSSRYEVRA